MNLSNMNPAQQARALGLVVGDTIEGTLGQFTARLTLLWLGERVAVWMVTERFTQNGGWTTPWEKSTWNLDGREWVKIGSEPPTMTAEQKRQWVQDLRYLEPISQS